MDFYKFIGVPRANNQHSETYILAKSIVENIVPVSKI